MEKIDVVIVGGGLSGLSCAYKLADQGLQVIVVERGDFPGSKNVTGGRLYLEGFLVAFYKNSRLSICHLFDKHQDFQSATLPFNFWFWIWEFGA